MRRLENWLDSYLEYTFNTEPPLNYHVWTSLVCISAVLQRRCYLRSGHNTIYPNLYVVLIGEAGRTRKGTAVRIGRRLLSQIKQLKIIPESITREGLINTMKKNPLTFMDEKGVFRMHSSVLCLSEELQVFLGIRNTRFLADLTDWYDSHDNWTYETISRGSDQITGVCFTLLGCSAPDWIPSMFPLEAIGGGFTSRVLFVYEERKRKRVKQEQLTDKELQLGEDLTHDLQDILTMSGEFKMTKEAAQFYEDWYDSNDAKLDDGDYPVNDTRFNSYCERRATHARKLSMIISAARSNDLIIRLGDLHKAIEYMTNIEAKMPNIFAGIGRSKNSEVLALVMKFLRSNKSVLRSSLTKRFASDMSSEDLRQMEEYFKTSKLVKIDVMPSKGDCLYTYVGE